MEKLNSKKLQGLFQRYPAVKLVYLFGSQATGNTGPLSDFDFAIFLDGANQIEMGDIQLALMADLAGHLQSDKIDLVVLNSTESPELKYNIITQGKLIYEQEPFRVVVEPRILNEYFDFYYLLKKLGLTRA